jgi:hypothetical protein
MKLSENSRKKILHQLELVVNKVQSKDPLFMRLRTEVLTERAKQEKILEDHMESIGSQCNQSGFFAAPREVLNTPKVVHFPAFSERAAVFYLSLLTFKYKDKITSDDVHIIKLQAENFKNYLLESAQARTITEYGSLVNDVLNFINFCTSFFTKNPVLESKNFKEVNISYQEWVKKFNISIEYDPQEENEPLKPGKG